MILEQIFGKKKFTDSEKQIADFIEANPRVVINLSLNSAQNVTSLRRPSSASVKSLVQKALLSLKSNSHLP